MRLWSIDFSYLDGRGLVALWREALLAKSVLEGKTKGYKNHPQLERFKRSSHPLHTINEYLFYIHEEAERRGYKFDSSKLSPATVDFTIEPTIPVTEGQLWYELNHLHKKLLQRCSDVSLISKVQDVLGGVAPVKECALFSRVPGQIESWEKI